MKLQPLALGIAFGLIWSFGIFLAGIFAMFGWGNAAVEVIASFYLGYGASITGAMTGALWAVIDGFCAGYAIAWLYNKAAK